MQPAFLEARQKTMAILKETNIKHHMFYQPTSANYWNEPFKLLMLNLEPYGYEDCGFVDVDEACLTGWMFDEGDTGTRTLRYSTAAAAVLLDNYHNKTSPTPEAFRDAYKDTELLKTALGRICYYNLRTSSHFQKQQSNTVSKELKSKLGNAILQELLCLEPTVIILSGAQVTRAFKELLFRNDLINNLDGTKFENTIFMEVKHFSRPRYHELCKAFKAVLNRVNAE